MTHVYKAVVLEELARHGLRPAADTPPQILRDAMRDLYKYEIKVLRGRLLADEFPKAAYAGKVVELRCRYPLLSIPMEVWMSEEPFATQ